MKILIISTLFPPSVGGIETVSEILALELRKLGNDITVLTDTAANSPDNYPFTVIRKPSLFQIFKYIKWCDVSLHACVSLKYIWQFLIVRRPVFATHHTWYKRHDGSKNFKDIIKLFLTRFINNIAVSEAVKKSIPAPVTVIENPYKQDIFKLMPGISRNKDLVFLGRLVSDKGADLILKALIILRNKNIRPSLSIIGDGPELSNLTSESKIALLDEQVQFLGKKSGEELAQILNQHKIMLIPSRWEEPYGIVALEGLACGLDVIAAESGGLPEAVKDFGLLFERGNAEDLAAKIEKLLLASTKAYGISNSQLETHLSSHKRESIAKQYLSIIETAL